MKEKISLEEIIENLDFGDELLYDITHNCYGKTMYTIVAMKKAMLEAIRQGLGLASEKAEMEFKPFGNYYGDDDVNDFNGVTIVKESILNVIDFFE